MLNTLTLLSIMIFSGMFMGRAVKHIRLPNVTGYIIAGLILGPSVLNIANAEALSGFSIISEAALGFIAFSIGCEFKLSYFKEVGAPPIVIACLESFAAVITVFIGLMAVGQPFSLSLLLGAIAAATAPAATVMVIKQYNARGPMTKCLLSVVAIDDATTLAFFSIAAAVVQAAGGKASSLASYILLPVREIGGALAIGALLGIIFLLPLRFFKKSGNRLCLIIAFLFLGLGISSRLGLSNLLLCMSTGAVLANLSPDISKLMDLTDEFTPPLFLLFFVISGADLQLSVLPSVGLIGAVYIVTRVIGKIYGTSLGAVICKSDKSIKKYLGPCLLPQAGVAIGLSLSAAELLPQYASQIRAVVLSATLVYELAGPAIIKASLKKSGEIGGQ